MTTGSYWRDDEILPGNWGRQTRRFGVELEPILDSSIAINLLWETALESVRRSAAPHLPSRLECVFACESSELAVRFRDTYRKGAEILQIEFNPTTSLHRGDFELISSIGLAGSYVDYMADRALRYWTMPPSELVEVLIGGPVLVLGRLEGV